MRKTLTAACVLTAALAATSFAQTSTSGSSGTLPGATQNQLNAPAQTNQNPDPADSAKNVSGRYITENRPDLWRASELMGMTIYNEQNEGTGDVSEVLLNRQGQVEAVVIGVGGFLGIGQRNVAVPFNALQWQMTQPATATAPATGQSSDTTAITPTRPAQPADRTGEDAAEIQRDRPERAVLAGATRDQLSNAPEFRYAR